MATLSASTQKGICGDTSDYCNHSSWEVTYSVKLALLMFSLSGTLVTFPTQPPPQTPYPAQTSRYTMRIVNMAQASLLLARIENGFRIFAFKALF